MRWRAVPPPPPQNGDTRTRYPFAWRRTRVQGDYIVWLERYEVNERFFLPPNPPGWWSEVSRTVYNPVYY